MRRRTRKDRKTVDVPGQLADTREYADAIDVLVAAYRRFDADALAIGLVDLRIEAAGAGAPGPGRVPWPPEYADPFPDLHGRLPEIDADELTSEILGGAVRHHGALVARGMLDEDSTAMGVEAIRHAERQYDVQGEQRPNGDGPGRTGTTEDNGWYRPAPLRGDKSFMQTTAALRRFVRQDGGTWLADSPRATAFFLDQLAARGVVEAIRGHFGERPVISVQKSTLRRTPTGERP